ncbi:RNA-guided endonuclease TnpB family protein [soil metagenome]
MRLTYKYRLTPTAAQRTKLDRTLEICRWVYNATLGIRKDTFEQTNKGLSLYDTNKLLTVWKESNPAFSEVHSQVLQNVQERVDLAYKAFFRRVKAGEEPGYPRFKGKGLYDSFTFKQVGFRLDGDKLTLSKIGTIRVKLHRDICGTIKTLTIQRDSIGNWYACFSCDCEVESLPVNHNVVGIDLGLTTFAYFSNGHKIERQRWMKRDADAIAKLQRRKERFTKGSLERKKVIRALNHAYQRSANRRNNFAHQESRKLVNEYQFIAFEKLDIQDMQQSDLKTITRGMADVAWGQFVQFTVYKAANAGRGVALVNPRGTTQMCSGCSMLVAKDLSVRIHDCPHCGLKLSRDHNAALNILARGLASFKADNVGLVEAHDL